MSKENYDTHRIAVENEDADWQRVNSYIADIVKDVMLTYSKLARLRGDFVGKELDKISEVSTKVREVGEVMLAFSKAFNNEEYSISQKEHGDKNVEDYEFKPEAPPVEDFDLSEKKTEEKPSKEEPPIEDYEEKEEKPKKK